MPQFSFMSRGLVKSFVILLIIFSLLMTILQNHNQDLSQENEKIAEIGGFPITASFFQNSLTRFFQESKNSSYPKDLQNLYYSGIKYKLLNEIINEQALKLFISEFCFSISNQQLQNFISSLDFFWENKKFSIEKYFTFLKQNRISSADFEDQQRKNLSGYRFMNSISSSTYIPNRISSWGSCFFSEKRFIKVLAYPIEDFYESCTITYEDMKSWFEKNKNQPTFTKIINAKFIVLDKEKFLHTQDSEIINSQQENQSLFPTEETRTLSQIFIKKPLKDNNDKNETYRKIQFLKNFLLEKPDEFSKIAFEYSEDSSSWDGGNMGRWNLLDLSKMINSVDASLIFDLGENQISNVVESETGYHIFQVTEIHPKYSKDLIKSQENIVNKSNQELSHSLFSNTAEKILGFIHEGFDLDEIAGLLDLKLYYLQSLDQFRLSQGDFITNFYDSSILKSEKFLQSLFRQENTEHKENPISIDISPNISIFLHMNKIDLKDLHSFEQTKELIYNEIRREQSVELSGIKGSKMLDKVKLEESSIFPEKFSPLFEVSRLQSQNFLSEEIVDFAMSLKPDSLPFYDGIITEKGFYILKLEEIKSQEDNEHFSFLVKKNLESVLCDSEIRSIFRILRKKYNAKIFATEKFFQ